jgi:hypothetical protein
MCYGLHEMCFTEAGIPINEEGVVNLAWSLTYGMSSGSGELVGLADDEEIEGITPTQRWRTGAILRLKWSRSCCRWCHEKIHLRALFPLLMNAKCDVYRMAEDYWRVAGQQFRVL